MEIVAGVMLKSPSAEAAQAVLVLAVTQSKRKNVFLETKYLLCNYFTYFHKLETLFL